MKNYWLDHKKITLEECKNLHDSLKWDFNTALAETIKKKYESQYVKIVEIQSIYARKIR